MIKCYKDKFGNRAWRNSKGEYHRIDGPAFISADGYYKAWYKHDKLHRIGAPAVEGYNGSSDWYENGVMHRIDGPALNQPQHNHYVWHYKGSGPLPVKFQQEFEKWLKLKVFW